MKGRLPIKRAMTSGQAKLAVRGRQEFGGQRGAQAIVLAARKIPLAFHPQRHAVPVVNATRVLAEAAIRNSSKGRAIPVGLYEFQLGRTHMKRSFLASLSTSALTLLGVWPSKPPIPPSPPSTSPRLPRMCPSRASFGRSSANTSSRSTSKSFATRSWPATPTRRRSCAR